MNRRQKIIISVTGIFIVLLLLVGLTYGYFLTKINGNTNSKSISVSTANLQLVYGNDDGNVIGDGELIVPGTTFDAKTFTVKNEGNATTDYVVVIENATSTFKNNDFVYTLTCTSDGEPCTGVDTETTYPINGGMLVSNTIEVGKTHTYSFTLKYVDTNKDQSDDMNKTIEGKINIKDPNSSNPYAGNKETLAYSIINNAILEKNGTVLKTVPDTTPAVEVSYVKTNVTNVTNEKELDMSTQSSWYYANTYNDAQPWNSGGSPTGSVSECSDTIIGKFISYPTESTSWYVKSCKSSTIAIVGDAEVEYDYEQTLSVTQDDYGTSYYYRGNVTDNYVNFAGMCWRIVRIAGDGSTKLILEDKNTTCESSTYTGNWSLGTGNYGYDSTSGKYKMNYLNPVTSNTSSMVKAFYDFQATNLASYTDKLKAGDWCLGDTAYTRTGSSKSDYTYTLLSDTSSNYSSGTSFYYDAYARLSGDNKDGYNPSLKCNGTKLDKFATVTNVSEETSMYVSALTADEVVFAGGIWSGLNFNYYLINEEFKKNSSEVIDSSYFWTLSPSRFNGTYDNAFGVVINGSLGDYDFVHYALAFRPAVSLASNVKISSGTGTQTDSYVVE